MHRSPFATAYRLPVRPRTNATTGVRPQTLRTPRIFGRGRLSAAGLVLPIDSRIVAGWLPGLVRLAEQTVTPPGTHPVVILCGRQDAVHLNLAPSFRLSYRELVVMVPHTRIGGGEGEYLGPFMCPVALHLDRWLPLLLGRLVLAAPKAAARFENGAGAVRARRRDGRLVALLEHSPNLSATPTAAQQRELADVFQQPNVCLPARDRYRFFGADWRLHDADVRPLDVRLTLGDRTPGLSWSVDERMVRGFERPAAGVAFHLETHWLLGLPEKRSPALGRWRTVPAGRER